MARFRNASLQSMLKTVVLMSLAFTVPIVAMRFWGGFEGLELAAYDDFVRRRPAEKPDDRIVIVTIGDDDIEQLQESPIHDDTFAKILEKLVRYQPRAIGLDVARDIPQGSPAGRERLKQVIAKNDTIIPVCVLSAADTPGSAPPPGVEDERVASALFEQDADKTVRRVPLTSTPGQFNKPSRHHICNDARAENEIYSLSFYLAALYLERFGIKPERNKREEIQLGTQTLHRLEANSGSYSHLNVGNYQVMLNYRGANQVFREVSVVNLLNDKVDPQSIRDRVVLIGSTSQVAKDLLATPYSETFRGLREMFGVEVHAQAVSQILSAVQDKRPLIQSWSDTGEVIWLWAWSLGSGLIAFYNRRLGFFLIVLLGIGVALWGICYGLFLTQGLWVPFVPTLITAVLTALGVRLADLANRTGYAQAVYERLREQLQGHAAGRDRQGDYLAHLVQRAQAIRQGQNAAALLSTGAEPTTFATPQMQALYEQIAQKVRQDVAAEQLSQVAPGQPSGGSNKVNRIKNLLKRAQQARSQFAAQPNQTPDTSKPVENAND